MKKFTASGEQLTADVRYGSKLAAKFVNAIMGRGKKSVAQRVFYGALDYCGEKVSEKSPYEVFEAAVNNVKPQVEVKSKRVGGATYQVPVQVGAKRQLSLAIRWILDAARKKKGRPMAERLGDELVSAYNREGAAMTVRENMHKMAEANKAFAHFAW
jgi:small subunit ribosomal protein S7